MRSDRSDIISFLLAVPTVLRQGKRGQFSGVPMSPADCEDDKNDTESAVCQIDHRFAACLNFLVRRPPGLKINLFTLNENALCHESPRRARKKFHAPGLFCSGSPSPPGAEVTYHQQFGNSKGHSLKTLSAASDGGRCNEMMLFQGHPAKRRLTKTTERGKSVGRDSVDLQVVDRSQLLGGTRLPRVSPFFIGNMPMPRLLNLDLCPSRFDFLFHLVGFGFGHAFLDRLWRAFYKRFRFRQAKARHRAAHFLDHADLVGTHFL